MSDRRYVAYHVATILATPFLLLAVNPNLFITSSNGWIDPWLYTGFHLSLPEHLLRWGSTYYATRLAWLLPGFGLHQLFSPLLANYVLHISFFYVLLFSVYFLVTSGINRTVAFVVTLLVALNPETVAAMSWDYVDGAVITYFAVSLLCFEKAASGAHRWLWAAAAGAGLACLAASNLVAITLWPVCGLFLLLRVGVVRWRTTLAILAVAAAGMVAMLAVFGVLSAQLGGSFLFLKPSVTYASQNLWLPSPYDVKGTEWLLNSPALILPAVAALGALLAVAGRWSILRPFSGLFQVTTLAAVVWMVTHSVLWSHSIHIPYYTSYLVPLGLLALALHPDSPLISPAQLPLRRMIALELAILGLLIVHLVIFRNGDLIWGAVPLLPARLGTNFGINTYVAFGIAGIALLSLRFVRALWFRWPVFLLALLMAYSSVPGHWPAPDSPRVREDFTLMVSVHEFIREHLGQSRSLRMWYAMPPGEPRPYRSISSTYLWGHVLLNESMPSLESSTLINRPSTEVPLVLMAGDGREIDAARLALLKVGLSYTPTAQKQFGPRNATFQVIIGNVATP